MPQAMSYIPPTRRNEREKLSGPMNDELRQLSERYEKSEKYYKGKHPKSLIVEPDDPYDDNIVINVLKGALDRTLSFLFPSMPTFQFDTDSDGETEEERFIRDAWVQNGGAFFISKVSMNGAKLGHNFVRILPPTRNNPYPRLVGIRPGTIIVYWKADDMDTPIWYEQRWSVGDDEYLVDYINEADFAPEGQPEQWRIVQYTRRHSNEWTLQKEEIWPYYYGPIVDWQHLPEANEYYGRQETTDDQLALNRAINKVASDINRILRFHAFPKTVGTGLEAGDVKGTAIDGFYATPNEKANIYNLEMKSDLASSMNMLNFLNDTFLSQARVVIMKGTVKDFQRVTNTGIRAVFLDMIAKNQLLRWSYGTALQEISRRMLMVAGKDASRRPDIVWDDPLPQDDTEAINNLAIEIQQRLVSRETASKYRGYTWDEELKRMEKESALEYLQPQPGSVPAQVGVSNSKD